MQKISIILWIIPLLSIASNDEFDTTTAAPYSDQSLITHPSAVHSPAASNTNLDSKLGADGRIIISSFDRVRSVILKHLFKLEKKNFIGLIIIPCKCYIDLETNKKFKRNLNSFLSYYPDIVCFFAAKGFWPFYPHMLQLQVNEMGKKIFAQSDDKIRQFCRGKFNFPDTCYRPGRFNIF